MKKKPKLSSLRSKADKMLQQLGRKLYEYCEICGQPVSCLHHYFPKSMAGGLRYNLKNCIPICQGCHFSHHNGNPNIHATVLKKRGQKWHDSLLKEKQKYTKVDRIYYELIIDNLKKALG